MVDARLRDAWLTQMRFMDLSDIAWRVFTGALMWSVGQGTDGEIPKRYLRYLHPDGVQDNANRELVKAGLWMERPDAFQLVDWPGDLGQSTAQQVEDYRESARVRQQRKRARAKQTPQASGEGADVSGAEIGSVTPGVTPNVTRDITPNVGKATAKATATDSDVTTREKEVTLSWPVVQIPKDDPGICTHGVTVGARCSDCFGIAREAA